MSNLRVKSICLSNKILNFTAQFKQTSRIGGSHEPLIRVNRPPFLLLLLMVGVIKKCRYGYKEHI